MIMFRTRENKNQNNFNDEAKQNPISKISKKGKTLGAEHASHGDFGVEKMTKKSPAAKTAKSMESEK